MASEAALALECSWPKQGLKTWWAYSQITKCLHIEHTDLKKDTKKTQSMLLRGTYHIVSM